MPDWKSELDSFFEKNEQERSVTDEKLKATKAEVARFYSSQAIPAFEELKTELSKHGREANVDGNAESTGISVRYNGAREFDYRIEVRITPGRAYPVPVTRFSDPKDGKTYKAEGSLRSGSQDYTVSSITKDEIIEHFLVDYKRHVSRL